jgi:hypothetical protein
MKHLKLPEKQKQTIPQASRQREIIKIMDEINETETKIIIQRINETKTWFFEKINKINKPFANMTKQRKGKIQINKIKDKKGDITINTNEIQKIIREYFGNL